MKIRLFWAAAALFFSGCAAPALQTEAMLRAPRDIAGFKHIDNVEFIQQSEAFCGPATLAMVMGWSGHKVSLEEIGKQVYTPGKKGSLQADMLGASRRQGMMAMQIHGMQNLLREVEAGHPVIVLENLAFSWYPYWHYSVVIGYDLAEPAVIMHSGSKQNWHYGMRKFERNWKYGDYWGLVVLPAGELSATASELEHATAAAALEQLGMKEKAEIAYTAILRRWPSSFGALLGMGNLTYARGAYEESVKHLKNATRFHSWSSSAWHNLALAEAAAKKVSQARRSAAQAMKLASPQEKAAYSESLRAWISPKL